MGGQRAMLLWISRFSGIIATNGWAPWANLQEVDGNEGKSAANGWFDRWNPPITCKFV